MSIQCQFDDLPAKITVYYSSRGLDNQVVECQRLDDDLEHSIKISFKDGHSDRWTYVKKSKNQYRYGWIKITGQAKE